MAPQNYLIDGDLEKGKARQCLQINPELSLFLFDDESILYSKRSQRLLGLDFTATGMLLKLAEGVTVDSLASELTLNSADYEQVMTLAAILGGCESEAGYYRQEPVCPKTVSTDLHDGPFYQLLTTIFTIECSDKDLRARLHDEIAHLQVVPNQHPSLVISLSPVGGRWILSFNGAAQSDEVLPEKNLLTLLLGRLRMFVFHQLPYLLTLHAAAVTNGQQTLVFPGVSGSGKSTLAASLLAKGFTLVADEIVIFSDSSSVCPVPLGIGVKEGSWSVLQKDYPEILSQPEHYRWDQLRVRYLGDGQVKFANNEIDNTDFFFFFPSYAPDSIGEYKRISTVNALWRLNHAGYQVRYLDDENVPQIIDLLSCNRAYELSYSSSEEAFMLINSILAE
ncbi:hypothetical protein P9J64_00595 [Deltaproteobacteria bacterium IMCC39524]|nr:hypothetical protein [Deltaproteobacteria bacterium IMCC39524]